MKKGMIIATLGLAISPMSLYAADTELITIIGPDGRPMNIERKISKPTTSKPKTTARLANRNAQMPTETVVPAQQVVNEQKIQNQELTVDKPALLRPQAPINNVPEQQNKTVQVRETPITQPQVVQPAVNVDQQSAISNAKAQVTQKVQTPASTVNSPFMQLEGEDYVDSDYLEQAEFNLEGKKRFYHIPSLVGAPVELVERKKGLSLDFLNKFQKQKDKIEDQPVVFASTYTRIDQNTVKDMLAQQCVDRKALKKAKSFNAEKARHLWPSKPIKDEFDFSLVKLDQTMQDVQIISFASNEKKPTYYWPFVVFLNEQGCIEEGVMGFRTGQKAESVLQHAAIEGVVRIPSTAKYILMTPLEAAIDAEDYQLTNEGQLKLVALR